MTWNLTVRNVGDVLVARLKRRAARHGQSAASEVRDILRQVLDGAAVVEFEDLASELRSLTAGRRHTPAEVLLRESRDAR